jgi:hypothetical protein
MKLKVTVILAIALQSSFSVSQYDRPVPNLPVPQHQWKIASVVFRRFINTTPKLTGYFMLDRFFYDPCATAPGETIMPQHECGIRATTYPSIQCSSWPDQFKVGELGEVSIEDKDQQGTEVYTCHTYRTGKGYDIKSLPKEEKKWLKWKMFDLRESTIVPNPRGQSFQSVQFELTNGVPVVK